MTASPTPANEPAAGAERVCWHTWPCEHRTDPAALTDEEPADLPPISCGMCGYIFLPEHAALFTEGADVGFSTAKLYPKDDPTAPNEFYRTDRHENDPEHIIHRCSACCQCARAFA